MHFNKKHMMQYQQDKQAQNTMQSYRPEYPSSPSSLGSGKSTPTNDNKHLERPSDYTRGFSNFNHTQNSTNNFAVIENLTKPTQDEIRRFIQSATILQNYRELPTPPTQEAETPEISQYNVPPMNPFVWAQLNQLKEMHLAEEAARNREIHQNPSAMNPNFWGTFNQPHNLMQFNEEARNQGRVDPRVMNPFVWAKLNQIHLKEELKNREIIQYPSVMNPNHWTTFNQPMNSVPSNGETTNQGMVDPIAMNQFLLARLHQLKEMHFTEQSRAREINQDSLAMNSHHWVNFNQLQERPFIKEANTQEVNQNPSALNPNLWTTFNQRSNSMPSIEQQTRTQEISQHPTAMNTNPWAQLNQFKKYPFMEEVRTQEIHRNPSAMNPILWAQLNQLKEKPLIPEAKIQNLNQDQVDPSAMKQNLWAKFNKSSNSMPSTEEARNQNSNSWTKFDLPNNTLPFIKGPTNQDNVVPTTLGSNAWTKISQLPQISRTHLQQLNYPENSTRNFEETSTVEPRPRPDNAVFSENKTFSPNAISLRNAAQTHDSTPFVAMETPTHELKSFEIPQAKINDYTESSVTQYEKYPITGQSAAIQGSNINEAASYSLFKPYADDFETTKYSTGYELPNDKPLNLTYKNCQVSEEKPESVIQKELVTKHRYRIQSQQQFPQERTEFQKNTAAKNPFEMSQHWHPQERPEFGVHKELDAENRYELKSHGQSPQERPGIQKEFAINNLYAEKPHWPQPSQAKPTFQVQKDFTHEEQPYRSLPQKRPEFVGDTQFASRNHFKVSAHCESPKEKPKSVVQKELVAKNPCEVESHCQLPKGRQEFIAQKELEDMNRSGVPQKRPELVVQKDLASNNPHVVESPEDTPEYEVRKIAFNQYEVQLCQLPQETPEVAEPQQPITIEQELTAPQDNNSLNQEDNDEFSENLRQLKKRIMSTLSIADHLQKRFEAFKEMPNVFVLDHTTAEHTEQINNVIDSMNTQLTSTTDNTTENNHPQIQYPYPSPDDGTKFIIGPRGTTISKDEWLNINWYNSTTAITRNILAGIFDRETLATHNLTGRPSPAFVKMNMPNKGALDADKVADTIYIVTNRTNASAKEVRMAITTKCSDECKMYKWREKNFYKIYSRDHFRPQPY